MTFYERLGMAREGHEMTCVSVSDGVHWCIRCGVVWLDATHGRHTARWEAPRASGDSRASDKAPACVPSTAEGAANPAGDARLMLHALTHGWRCDPITLPAMQNFEAWRWSREGLLGGEAWSVPGPWSDGPVVNDAVRRELLLTADNLRVTSHG